MENLKSIWHDAFDLQRVDAVGNTIDLSTELGISARNNKGRFATVIGSSDDHKLNLLTSYVEMNRFGLQFGNKPEEMVKLYGDLGESICMLVIDNEAEGGPAPASASRLAIGHVNKLDHLPSIRAIQKDAKDGENFYVEPIWHISKGDYRKGLEALSLASGSVFDGSTIACMPEYRDHSASLPIFSAYARMAINNYRSFDGVFLSTMVEVVADMIGDIGGYKVLTKFPGTTNETFYGARETAPRIGIIDRDKFGDAMARRVSTDDLEVDEDGSTYHFV